MSRFLTNRARKPIPSGMLRTPEERAQDSKFPTFGQYAQGRNPQSWGVIAEINPQYIVWCFESVKNKPLCSRPLAEFCGVRFGAPSSTELEDDEDLDDIGDDIPF